MNTRKGTDIRLKWIDEITGNYRDCDYIVRFSRLGHRCGYVKINSLEIFAKLQNEYQKDCYCPSIDCHGGVTFVEQFPENGLFGDYLPGGNWIGFDCAHYNDARDYDALNKYFGESEEFEALKRHLPNLPDQIVRDKGFVEKECRRIIEQLEKMEAGE